MKNSQLMSANNKPYQAFFKKRIQTQSFLNTEMSETNMSELTTKIIKSLKDANSQNQKLKEKMFRAKTRQKTLQNEEEQSRQKLKSKLQDRMRISRTNLQKMKQQRKKINSSRSEFESSQRKRIKQSQKRYLEQSLVRSTKYQQDSQKFFRQTKDKKMNEFKRLQELPRDKKYESFYPINSTQDLKDSRSKSVSRQYQKQSKSSINKKATKMLKVSDKEIKQKQQKKVEVQKGKQSKFLGEYIRKMQEIINIRSKNLKKKQPPKETLPKVINKERQIAPRYNKKSGEFKNMSMQSSPKKKSFSDYYEAKLEQKLAKKQYYHSVILSKGDQILLKQHERTKKIREDKIIKDAINDYKRWSNFRHHQ